MKSHDDKLDYVVEQIGGINKTLEFQSKQLESHIKRTEILENRVIPIEDHVKFIQGSLRVALYASSIAGAAVGVIKLLLMVHK